MNHSDRSLETAHEHIDDLRLEASLSRELQLTRPSFNLRRRLARALRAVAASLEPEVIKTATSS
jgi:hypothetical protein